MAKKIIILHMMVKLVGNSVEVRHVTENDDGTYDYGQTVLLAANEKAQLRNVARSLIAKLEA